MITIKYFGEPDIGRLGNQIFQFAFLYGIYKKKNYSINLPKLEGSQFWKCFDIIEPEIKTFNIDDYKFIVEESGGCYNFDQGLADRGDGCMYNGYFQSYLYFDEFKEDLIATLKFKEHIVEEGEKELEKFASNLTSVHVRRTDYLSSPIWGDLVKEGYYEKACADIKEEDDVLVFSDDVEFVRVYFKDKKNYHVVEKDEYVSLYMMTRCSGHIIANSSFSWMGAYLSGKENIICPDPWMPSIFPAPNNIQKNITKKEWKKINVFK